MPSIVLVFLSVCFFYSFYDYYLFTCFSIAINYFCDLNSALSLSAQNTRIRKTLFFSEQDMLRPAITESIRMNSHRELNCTNAISLQVINSIYPSFNMIHICFGHLPISVTVLSNFHFPISPWQLHKVSKNNNGKLFSCK